MPTNQIFIKDFTVIAKHGYYKEEHYKPQRFVVNVVCDVIANESGSSDDLNVTFNYELIRKEILEVLNGEHHKLLEYLAESIANNILKYKIVSQVEVEIHKPDIWGDCNPGVKIKRAK